MSKKALIALTASTSLLLTGCSVGTMMDLASGLSGGGDSPASPSTTRTVSYEMPSPSPTSTTVETTEPKADEDIVGEFGSSFTLHGRIVSERTLYREADKDPEVGSDLAAMILNTQPEYNKEFTRKETRSLGERLCSKYSQAELDETMKFYSSYIHSGEQTQAAPALMEQEFMPVVDEFIDYLPGTREEYEASSHMGAAGAIIVLAIGGVCPYEGYHQDLLGQ